MLVNLSIKETRDRHARFSRGGGHSGWDTSITAAPKTVIGKPQEQHGTGKQWHDDGCKRNGMRARVQQHHDVYPNPTIKLG